MGGKVNKGNKMNVGAKTRAEVTLEGALGKWFDACANKWFHEGGYPSFEEARLAAIHVVMGEASRDDISRIAGERRVNVADGLRDGTNGITP